MVECILLNTCPSFLFRVHSSDLWALLFDKRRSFLKSFTLKCFWIIVRRNVSYVSFQHNLSELNDESYRKDLWTLMKLGVSIGELQGYIISIYLIKKADFLQSFASLKGY